MENNEELNQSLRELAKGMQEATAKHQKEVDQWWNALSQDDRERAFYAVSQRIHTADLKEQRSFRGAIYGVFGFGPEMYGRAMDCGYLSIHNAIVDGNNLIEMTSAKQLEVIKDGFVTSWPDVETLSLRVTDGKLIVKINRGNDYV